MQRLSGLDASFVYMESPTTHMHVAQVCILDPSTAPGGLSFDKARSVVESRLHLLPPFRRRLVTVPLGLHHPCWIEDPNFDLDYHIHRAALPSPGGMRELVAFVAELVSRPLQLDRPLWELYLVEGLEGGMVAGVCKVHHSAIDGVSGAELTAHLMDLSPDPPVTPPPEEPWIPDEIPSELGLIGSALAPLARQPISWAQVAGRVVRAGQALRERNRRWEVKPPPAPFSAPRSSLNVNVTPQRRVAFTQVSLDDVKTVRNALGGTINDVVLALCSGALRSYLEDMEEDPGAPLVALVPVSLRSEEDAGIPGNKISLRLVSLASDVAEPAACLRSVIEGCRQAKEQDNALGLTFAELADAAPAPLISPVYRLATSLRIPERAKPPCNVVISNIAGPPFPLYFSGARMVTAYPMGPVADGVALNITVQSYMGSLFFGLVSCAKAVPDLWSIAQGIEESLDQLLKAAAPQASPRPLRQSRRTRSITAKARPGGSGGGRREAT